MSGLHLKRDKSKWLVVGCAGLVYSTHKSRKAAEQALELQEAMNAWANGWDRLTERQQNLINQAESQMMSDRRMTSREVP